MTQLYLLDPKNKKTHNLWEKTIVGGKNYHLFKMYSQRIPIPFWITTTTLLFDQCLSPIKNQIDSEIQTLDLQSSELEIKKVEENIKKIIKDKVVLPIDVKKRLQELPDKYYAVRSSGNIEDSKELSFAGQFDTYLYVPKQKIEESIINCWCSAYNSRLMQYLLQKNQNFSVKLAVIIQEIFESERSGIMFTADPRNAKENAKSIIISGGFGLGEGIVSDQVESDTFTVNKKSFELISQTIQEKFHQIILNNLSKEGTIKTIVTHKDNALPILNKNEIENICQWGIKLERIFHAPQDIEWGINKNNDFAILQSRPITTFNHSVKNYIIIDNSNIVESYPGINTPLTIDVIAPLYARVFGDAVKRLGLTRNDYKQNKLIFENLLSFYKGRVYYNVTHWYKMMRLFPFTEKYIRVWEKMLGVDESELTNQEGKKTFKHYFRFLIGTTSFLYYFFTLDKKFNQLEKKMAKSFQHFWDNEYNLPLKLTLAELHVQENKFLSDILTDWDLTLINDIYAFIFSATTESILNKCHIVDQNGHGLFNAIMNNLEGMDSVGPLESVNNLAKIYQNEGKSNNYEMHFNAHLNQYGDRAVSELKLETQTFREYPENLEKLINEKIKQSAELASTFNFQEEKWPHEIIMFKKNNPFKYYFFHKSYKYATRSILYREKFRLYRSRLFGVLRRIYLNAGEQLVIAGAINCREDIFYLKRSEFFSSNNLNWREIIESRKNEFKNFTAEKVESKYIIQNDQYTPLIIPAQASNSLSGVGCSSGIVSAEAIVIQDISTCDLSEVNIRGKILVAPMTDPGWVFLMSMASGLIVEKGSMLSHTAIIGRELNIPTIVGVKNATTLIKTGDKITMNAQSGVIYHV